MKLSEKIQEALREQQEINLSDPAVQTALRERVMDAIAEALGDAYDCTRRWSAWGYGTMSQDDFSLVADDSDRIGEIADAAIGVIGAQNAPTIAEQDQINAEAAIRSIYGAQPAPSAPEFCPCCGNVMRACMMCPNEDCNAVTVTAGQAKYNKQHALARNASIAAAPEVKP